MIPKLVLLWLLTFSLISISTSSFSQPNLADIYMNQFNTSRQIPDNLQSTRSVVIVVASPDEDWKKLSQQAHPYLKRMHIDAVAYYNGQDVFAGLDPLIAFMKQFEERLVRNLIFIKSPKVNDGMAEVRIIPFKEKLSLDPDNARSVWGALGQELKDIFKILGNDIIKADLENTNFLVMDRPLYFDDADMIKGTRFEVHSRDLRAVKLAVPKFKPINSNLPEAVDYNNSLDEKNATLEEIMLKYPYEYGFVTDLDEKALYREGYQYVLLSLKTSGINVKKLLNLQLNPGETEYVSLNAKSKEDVQLHRYPVEKVVHKYYVKHLLTGDIYVGDKWDSGVTWEEALDNFLNNLILFTAK